MNIIFSLKPSLQAIIAGFITGLSFHPLNIGFFSWFSFIPLFHIFLISNLKQSLFYGYVFGLSFNLTAFYWIGSNSGADSLTVIGSLIAATSYLAIFWLIAGFLFSLIPIEHRKGSGSFIFPFLIVSIIMPIHVRHLQRARMYGLFIPAVFLSIRYPWFLIPLLSLFFILRTYHYFRFNIVIPTFAVHIE